MSKGPEDCDCRFRFLPSDDDAEALAPMQDSTSRSSAMSSVLRCAWKTSRLRTRAVLLSSLASASKLFLTVPRLPPLPEICDSFLSEAAVDASSPSSSCRACLAAAAAAASWPQISAVRATATNIAAQPGLDPRLSMAFCASAFASWCRKAWQRSDTTVS